MASPPDPLITRATNLVAAVWQPETTVMQVASPSLQNRLRALAQTLRPALLTGLATGGLVLALRALGAFQGTEVRLFDQMVRWRSDLGPDPRLLIVTISEDDIRRIRRWPLPDETIAAVLQQLQQHKPRAIGLDLYRNYPEPPGTAMLYQQFKASNIIGIKLLPTPRSPFGVEPPPLPETQVGFNDVPIDPDQVVRRSLLLTNLAGKDEFSFAFRLADLYLKGEGIEAQQTHNPRHPDEVLWGKMRLHPLLRNTGGYQTIDDGGYQILLNYRSRYQVSRTLPLEDLLQRRFDPAWIRDKVVLVGTIAPSSNDVFFTPYAGSGVGEVDMPGVMLQAQMVSQLIGAGLGERPLWRFWPEWVEVLWLLGWAGVGGLVALQVRHPLRMLGSQVVLVAGGMGIYWVLILNTTWVPMVAPLLAGLGSSLAIVLLQNYRTLQEQRRLAEQADEQEQAILSLQLALAQHPAAATQIQVDSPFQRDGLLANRYKIQKVLAAGGFGITYVANDMQRPGEPACVVKRLRPGSTDQQFLEIARRLFKAEAEILEVLGRHDRIPQLLAYFEDTEDFYLVEELIQGQPLQQELVTDKRSLESQVIEILANVLPTLAFIHDRHIIHRDIKPNNIIRRTDGALVLIDFGAVKQIKPSRREQAEANQTIAIGTQGYAAPEQLAGHPRLSSDIYALGVIAIQALTGIPPHLLEQDSQTGNLIWEPFTQCSSGLRQVVDRMTCYHFSLRYPSAIAVLEDIRSL